jgi:outer membrane murein-binding lipoprotein Lpp
MTTLTLYELAEEAAALDDLTAMEDGEWTPEADTLHTELMDKLVSKADAFASYLRDLETREETLASEIARLTARKKRLASRIQWMKSYAASALQRMDRPRLEGTLFTIALHKNPPSLLVNVLPDSLPPEYVRVIPEQREPDKKALMEAVKAGADIPGVELAPTTYHIRVK